jgi:TRAP-type C4-dicarboxylate transport system substrate-binding protein
MTTRLLIRLGLACAALAAWQAHGSAADFPKTELQIVGSMAQMPATKEVERPFWAEHILKGSGGAIEVKVPSWNELGLKGSETLHLVRQGVYDGAALVMAFNSGEVPINDGWDLAGLAPSVEDARANVEAFFPTIAAHYEKELNLKMLAAWPFPPQVVFCRNELSGVEDLKGRRVRTSTASQADFVRAFGGADVNVAFGEVQAALQSGVVDCALTSSMSAYTAGWYEAAKYYYPLSINWQIIVLTFNKAKWDQLDPNVQAYLTEEAKVLADQMWKHVAKTHEEGGACLTGEGTCSMGRPGNMTMLAVKAEDIAALKAQVPQSILPRWAGACGADCVAAWNDTVGKRVGISAK